MFAFPLLEARAGRKEVPGVILEDVRTLKRGQEQEMSCWCYQPGETRSAAPGGLSAVDGRIDTDSHSAVGANVVLVGTVLTALSSDALQLLLSGSISVADLHQEALFANGLSMVALDDLLAKVTGLETAIISQLCLKLCRYNEEHSPRKTDSTAVSHAVAKDLARQDLVGIKDGNQLLHGVS